MVKIADTSPKDEILLEPNLRLPLQLISNLIHPLPASSPQRNPRAHKPQAMRSSSEASHLGARGGSPWGPRAQRLLPWRHGHSRASPLSMVHCEISWALSTSKAKSTAIAQSLATVIPSSLLAAEREEAKAVLSLYLTKQGLSTATAARVANKSDAFIDHLISMLQSKYKTRYLVGRELTTLEIRHALVPYLDALLQEHGEYFVAAVENFPDPPGTDTGAAPPPLKALANPGTLRQRAMARVSAVGADGTLPEQVVYLMGLGMEHDMIKDIVRRFPAFTYYNADRRIRPVVELLLEHGVPGPDIPRILSKRPQLCGLDIAGNLRPMIEYFEGIGVDRAQWGKVICRFPALLTYSRRKVAATTDYMRELGVPDKTIGKILTRFPHIISYSVDDKLRPTADYFNSIGVDAASLFGKCPQTFGLSVEANLRPITGFFLEKGFSTGEIQTMVHRYSPLYTMSLSANLLPKWDFFLTMGYPAPELVKFPHYFGYSLKRRIRPRYARMMECGVRMILNQLLSLSDSRFADVLEKKMQRVSDIGVSDEQRITDDDI